MHLTFDDYLSYLILTSIGRVTVEVQALLQEWQDGHKAELDAMWRDVASSDLPTARRAVHVETIHEHSGRPESDTATLLPFTPKNSNDAWSISNIFIPPAAQALTVLSRHTEEEWHQ